MTEQIESGDKPPTLSYYVQRTATRRVLTPEVRNGKNGYLCKIITNATAEPGDTAVADETAFEKVLVDLRLMKPTNASRLLAGIWSNPLEDIRRMATQLQGSRVFESWLPILT